MKRPELCYLITFTLLTHAPSAGPTTFADVATSFDGVCIAYEVRGEGEPALVFIHGWCCDRSHWDGQLSRFSRERLVVTIDLAGHGESGHDRTDWTITAFGRDVAAVVEALGLEQVILIGNPWGGSVMLEAALQMPERVIGLVSVDGLVDPETTFPLEENLAPLRTDFLNTVEQETRDIVFGPNADSALVERTVALLTACPPEVALPAAEESLEYYNQGHYKSAIQRITVPIRGIQSLYPIDAEAFRPYTQSIEAVTMPGVGHLPMLENPEEFNRLLAKYVDEIADLRKSR